MPPWMPPELFVLVVSRGREVDGEGPEPAREDGVAGVETNRSLCWEPGTSQPPKPDPISNPFVAGMLSMACASIASSLSKHGSPSPIGAFLITQVTVPPILSFRSRYSAIISAIRFDALGSGHRTGRKSSTVLRSMDSIKERKAGLVEGVGWLGVGGKRCSLPTEETNAVI